MKPWNDLVHEHIRLESCMKKQEKVEEICVFGKMKKLKKGHKQEKIIAPRKIYLCKVKCFMCH